MTMIVSILKETQAGESRVALVPAVTSRLQRLGVRIYMESGASMKAKFLDKDYEQVDFYSDRFRIAADADILLAVQAPPVEIINALKPGAILISFLQAPDNTDLIEALRARRITSFAMERIPRISRAQAMDALSSQAALAGYYAPLLGAVHLPRILPMLTTAVGSLRAAKVLVLGLGVAGLQALATAHRLGAMTEGYDVRPETREQALSLGSKFVDTGIDARGEGGYARELSEDEKHRVAEVLDKHISEADMIITTASVPGRRAPRLVSAAQIRRMKPGAVIVDLGAESGGNCEGTEAGKTVEIGPVTIIGPCNVPSMLSQHASELYAKNLLNFVGLLVKDGELHIDFSDEILAGTAVTHEGTVR
ncbi:MULTISPECIES: NAD(P) transhydrogenase subunit alpha [Burkholderia]|uniref:proton-translocating NAD(P)(+) transhydrogenase n=2 Tax=Burkholderia gladioli TaxID=28095 RepID=A0A2A7SC99_BURGA|nr:MULTISPECIES: NAD(P) transhydrogenase subunit alpha [Burkholderia]MBJ9663242.1 NAD(P) transhydrogenase subunit alpha [Burkholderia gladioli]MBJ9713230.1 NAD(P) transhydrogenase subunit alpha [Burkholderia gladioli]MBU9155332.1 NAD(P) transhydrogenase subunit alpha [Burkholderia gladioli]MBU9197986.1 NAD(P) transhydrogenase subunit alpha [Burkholderia gladioli]MBU9214897.1 NAD(P) transhydrogenase subunit alpha [Burkholderia gladioli]